MCAPPPSNIPLVQYYRFAKSEIIAIDRAKEAADVARERNDFRLARIEREKQERAQKHAERAAGAKANATSEDDAKKAAIAAAMKRVAEQKAKAETQSASANAEQAASAEEGKA